MVLVLEEQLLQLLLQLRQQEEEPEDSVSALKRPQHPLAQRLREVLVSALKPLPPPQPLAQHLQEALASDKHRNLPLNPQDLVLDLQQQRVVHKEGLVLALSRPPLQQLRKILHLGLASELKIPPRLLQPNRRALLLANRIAQQRRQLILDLELQRTRPQLEPSLLEEPIPNKAVIAASGLKMPLVQQQALSQRLKMPSALADLEVQQPLPNQVYIMIFLMFLFIKESVKT